MRYANSTAPEWDAEDDLKDDEIAAPVGEGVTVVCPAPEGQDFGPSHDFATMAEAVEWAEWGHFCHSVSRHTFIDNAEGIYLIP